MTFVDSLVVIEGSMFEILGLIDAKQKRNCCFRAYQMRNKNFSQGRVVFMGNAVR